MADLEDKVKLKTQEIENLTTLIDIVSLLHGYYEINKFKYEKSHSYYNTVSKVIDVEDMNLDSVRFFSFLILIFGRQWGYGIIF